MQINYMCTSQSECSFSSINSDDTLLDFSFDAARYSRDVLVKILFTPDFLFFSLSYLVVLAGDARLDFC